MQFVRKSKGLRDYGDPAGLFSLICFMILTEMFLMIRSPINLYPLKFKFVLRCYIP